VRKTQTSKNLLGAKMKLCTCLGLFGRYDSCLNSDCGYGLNSTILDTRVLDNEHTPSLFEGNATVTSCKCGNKKWMQNIYGREHFVDLANNYPCAKHLDTITQYAVKARAGYDYY
jgi:hypothetical protein